MLASIHSLSFVFEGWAAREAASLASFRRTEYWLASTWGPLEAPGLDSAFLGELLGPGIPVLLTERVQSHLTARVGTRSSNLHHLSLSGSQAAGKLHVFVLD